MRDLDPFNPFELGRRRRSGLAALFASGQPGHWPDGYDPGPFTPAFLFSTTTPGHWSAINEDLQ